MATIQRSQLERASDNVNALEEIINGDIVTTVTTPGGQAVKSVAKALNDIALSAGAIANFTGNWDNEKTYSAGNTVLASNGIIYASNDDSNTGNNPSDNTGEHWTPLTITYAANVAALKEIVPTIDQFPCNLLGYYEPGDKPAITYIFDASMTTADNGGSVIKPDSIDSGESGRWYCADAFDIRDFGAKCDGSTNDSGAIKRTINHAISQYSSEGYIPKVTMPAKKILIDEPIEIFNIYGVEIEGDAFGTILYKTSTTAPDKTIGDMTFDEPCFFAIGRDSATLPRFTLKNIHLWTDDVDNSDPSHIQYGNTKGIKGIIVNRITNLNLENVNTLYCHTGLEFRDANMLTVERCEFRRGYNGIVNNPLTGSGSSNYAGTTFLGNRIHIVTMLNDGITFSHILSSNLNSVAIEDCFGKYLKVESKFSTDTGRYLGGQITFNGLDLENDTIALSPRISILRDSRVIINNLSCAGVFDCTTETRASLVLNSPYWTGKPKFNLSGASSIVINNAPNSPSQETSDLFYANVICANTCGFTVNGYKCSSGHVMESNTVVPSIHRRVFSSTYTARITFPSYGGAYLLQVYTQASNFDTAALFFVSANRSGNITLTKLAGSTGWTTVVSGYEMTIKYDTTVNRSPSGDGLTAPLRDWTGTQDRYPLEIMLTGMSGGINGSAYPLVSAV